MIKKMVIAGAMFGLFTLAWAAESEKGKESYLKKADTEVQEWTAKLKSLQERSEKTGAKTRQEIDRQLKVVNGKLDKARRNLEDLRTSNEGSWKAFRNSLEQTMRDIKRDYHNAVSLFTTNKNKKEES